MASICRHVGMAVLLLALFSASAMASAFTAGNLVIVQTEESDSNSPVTVIELDPTTAGQTPGNIIAIPGTGASGLRFSASATSTLYVANSNDGTRVSFNGVNSADTAANVNTLNPRGVASLDASGTYTLATTYTAVLSSNPQTRGSTTLNNTDWFIADQTGLFTNNGSTGPSPAGNFRSIKAFGGTVYVFTASTASAPVGTLASTSGSTFTALPGLPLGTASHQDFYLISSGSNGAAFDVLYILTATSNTAGTIQKFSLVSGSWTANGSYTTTFGGFGLAAAKSGAGAVLYVSTGQGALAANSLLKVTDTAGYNSTLSITTANNVTLYTAPANKIVKGVAFAPVAPTITGAATATAFTTTYGTASAAQAFPVSGSALTADITATAPTGFEVSSNGTIFGNTATFPQSSGSASGTLSVRLKATASVIGTYNSQNIALTSTGATTVNVATAASGNIVSAAALTITANNVTKPFGDTLTGGAGSNAFGPSGLVNGETVGTVTITYTPVAPSGLSGAGATDPAATYVGSIVPSAVTGGTFTASNYNPSYVAGNVTVSAGATISVTGSYTALSTIYGTPSASNAVSVSGSNLTPGNAMLTAAAPSGFEVSLSAASGFASSVNLTATGGEIPSTPVYVRLAATMAAGTFTGNSVGFTGGGALAQSAPIPSSTVTAKGLTITGITAVSREYSGDTDATLSGTPAYAGLENGDTFPVTGTPTVSFATETAGLAKPVTVVGYTAPSTNYTVSQPTGLAADITAKALTISSPAVTTKPFDGNTNATITGTLNGIISPDVVTLTGTGTFASAGPGVGIAVTSTSTLGGAEAGNYSLTQPIGLTGTIAGSVNANLSSLAISPGILSNGAAAPGFLGTVTNYRAYLTNGTASITVTPTLADLTASVTVNGVPVTSGSPTDAISLNEGANVITIVVTAQETATTKTYTINAFKSAPALTTGAIAFTGYNADGGDDIAFAALTTIPPNSVIFFSDNEWNGSAIGSGGAFNDFGESEMVWIAPAGGVLAGTVVTINNVSAATATSLGTVAFSDSLNTGYSNNGDTIYAFQGSTHLPSVFLAGLSADTASIANTGLTTGSTHVLLPVSSDGARYKGARLGQTTFADYLPLIGNVAANWDDIGGGDGLTLLPFSTTTFLAGPVANVTINDVSTSEGDAGATTFTFTVTRSNNLGAFTVHYATADGVGLDAATLANNDYQTASGDLTFTAGGDLSQPVSVTVNGDTAVEHHETFFVLLSNLVSTTGNANLTDASALGTILTDDVVAPTITTHPGSPSIAAGTSTTLTVVADGFPLPTYQWYEGLSGDLTNPVAGAMVASFTTPVLLTSKNYWVQASNSQGTANSNTAAITVSFATPFGSGNINVLTRNNAAWNPAGVAVGGTQFVNLGLQGVGRFPASAKDPVTGESLGSVSDMQITGFHRNGDGSFAGTFNFLPDRGYNNGAIYSNYAARINTFDFTFTPYTAPENTANQNQIAMTFTGSQRFTYDHDGNPATAPVFTTGLLANGGKSLFGTTVPVATGVSTQSDGPVTDRLTLDSEGLILDSRPGKAGSGWIGDEYGAYIYHFSSTKEIDGIVALPEALIPHAVNGGPISFIDVPANVDGRRVNQGVEGIAQSPDGTRLFGLMQSATMQDSGSGNQGRYNTRLLVYDVGSSDTPNNPFAQYVIQLPRIDDTGLTTNGSTVTRTGAQSSIIALNDHQLLILARDGNGRGVLGSASPVFKSILLADLTTATNIDGTYDAAGNAVAPGGTLAVGVTPISWTEALNMIGKLDSPITEVEKFGLNLQGGNGDINTICEKWEALGLVSANDPANPNDYFLFIGNDNDFLTATGKYLDATNALQNYDAGLENDTIVLAYRVRFSGPELLVKESTTEVANGATFSFGSVAPAGSTTKTFTIKNNGTTTLNIESFSIFADASVSFSLDGSTPNQVLAPGAETTIGVIFHPSTSGAKTAKFGIINNDFGDGTYTINLTGLGNHAPTLSLPTSPVVADAEDASGAHVTFTVTASDTEDGVLTPTVVPPSGSLFAPGDTTVHVSATDSAGQVVNDSFVVHVNDFVPPADPTFTTVYEKGGAVPNAGSDTRIQTGAVWTGFGPPAVNDAGKVAYVGKWKAPAASGVKAQSGIGIFVDGTLLVKTTEAVPGLTGAVFKTFKDPVIDAGGHVAFLATITNATASSVVTSSTDTVVVSNGHTGALEVLAREGSAAPGSDGATYKVFSNISIQGTTEGGTLFTASLSPGSGTPAAVAANDTGAWWQPTGSASVIKLIREGDAGFESGETIKSFVVLKPVAGSPGHGRGQVDGSTARLQVTLVKAGLVKQALVLASPGSLVNSAEAGDSLHSTAVPVATWAKLGLPSFGEGGDVLTILGSLKTGPTGVPAANALGIFQTTDGNIWEPVARAGFVPPGVPGSIFTSFKDPVNSPTSADVAFLGTSKVGKVGSAGLWWQPEGSALSLVALQGLEPVCGPAGAKWRSFTSLTLPGGLGPVFTAILEKGPAGSAGPGGITSANDVGLYAIDSAGTLHELLREGQTLGTKTVKVFNVLKAVAGSAGATRSFNNTGAVVVLVTYGDGTSAIVRINIPVGS